MVDVSKLLSKQVDDVKPPPLLPEGTYEGMILKYEFSESKEKKTPFVQYSFRFLSAKDDVDAEELKEIENLQTIERNFSFYLTDNSLFRLTNFIKSCGIRTEGRTIQETIEETRAASILIKVKHETDRQDPTKRRAVVDTISGEAGE